MTLTNTLKKQVDLPVWEWCRFTPVASAAGTTMCSPDTITGRYIYYNVAAGANFWRYDTWSDSWQQLANPINTPTSPTNMIYNSYHGFQSRVLSATSTTVTGSFGFGGYLSGNTIRIISGTGAGQDRTISSIAETIVGDAGIPTAIANTTITDTTKAWTINQWAGYDVRIVFGIGIQQIRKVLYNSATVLTIGDANLTCVDNQANAFWSVGLTATAGSQSQYTIESSVATVSVAWTTTPDYTSRYTVLSGGIWCLYAAGTAYGMQYYDVAADAWYAKTNNSGIISAGVLLATDVQMEQITESAGSFISSTATSGATSTLTDSTQTMAVGRYANYLIKILSGTGAGQTRTILANTATVFTVMRPWEVNPDATSVYKVFGDFDKIYVVGNGSAPIYQYSVESDQLITGKQLDWGTARIGAATLAGVNQQGIPLTSITSVTTTATATTAVNHNFQTGQVVKITGDTSANAAVFNATAATITVTGATTFTYAITSVAGASATFTPVSTIVLVDSTKSWTTNQFAGQILSYTTGVAAQTGVASNVQRQIVSNTATTITIAASTVITNGISRYTIYDVKSFGADTTQNTPTTVGVGTASSGSTTSLVDSSKSWATNQWSATTNRRLQIIAGTGAGALVAITSNTATQLNFATQSFSPDTTTQYRILDSFGYSTATGATTTLTDANQNWVTNAWAGQIVKFTSGTGVGQQSAIQSNTATVLTFSAVTTAPDATTTYSILRNLPTSTGVGICWGWGTTDTTLAGKYLIVARGGGNASFDRYDITLERWRNLSTSPFFETLTTGSTYAYDGTNRVYFQKDATNRFYYYDIVNNIIVPSGTAPYSVSTAVLGNRMEVIQTADGLEYIYWQRAGGQEMYRVLIFW